MPSVEFNRYYRFEELTTLLNAFATEFPKLIQISSIGKSHEGRDICRVEQRHDVLEKQGMTPAGGPPWSQAAGGN